MLLQTQEAGASVALRPQAEPGYECNAMRRNVYPELDLLPGFELWAISGFAGAAFLASLAFSGLQPLPLPFEPPLLMLTMIP